MKTLLTNALGLPRTRVMNRKKLTYLMVKFVSSYFSLLNHVQKTLSFGRQNVMMRLTVHQTGTVQIFLTSNQIFAMLPHIFLPTTETWLHLMLRKLLNSRSSKNQINHVYNQLKMFSSAKLIVLHHYLTKRDVIVWRDTNAKMIHVAGVVHKVCLTDSI